MKRPYYVFNSGRLRRKDNTIYFEPTAEDISPPDEDELLTEFTEDENAIAYNTTQRRVVPIDDIDSFYIFGDINFNSRFLQFLTKYNIPAHIFNHYGFYSGSYYPREYLNSGYLFVHQVKHYTSAKRRLTLAQKFVDGAAFNMMKNIRYYNARGCDLSSQILAIEHLTAEIMMQGDIPALMGIEGNIRQEYYSAFPSILKEQYDFQKRVKHPPDNAVNALMSFGNAMTYTLCLSELYRTQLSPVISYLHEPGERRFSLALDIAEIFKPLYADRTMFKVLNQKMIQHGDFDKNLNYCYLKEAGRKTFVKEYDERMQQTIEHRKLKKKVSYRRLVRLECYKIIKHLLGESEYEPFKMWW
ncbi:MAG TPA: type I-B CRISPR-associated endonuclease Cas1b [Candidatus Kapabacteria bacterium]|nr:type I-B CRISPR-associated endonuclease Cas1b [Candidatus Kapabacteria bacterium]